MRLALSCLLTICWALWFGGMMGLILFVTQLFGTSRDLGIHAAPVLFRRFVYQLIIGIIACASSSLLTLMTRRKGLAGASLLMILALMVALVIRAWTDQMLGMIGTGQSGGDAFRAMHNKTSAAYTLAAVLLFAAGIGLVICLRASSNQKDSGTDRA